MNLKNGLINQKNPSCIPIVRCSVIPKKNNHRARPLVPITEKITKARFATNLKGQLSKLQANLKKRKLLNPEYLITIKLNCAPGSKNGVSAVTEPIATSLTAKKN